MAVALFLAPRRIEYAIAELDAISVPAARMTPAIPNELYRNGLSDDRSILERMTVSRMNDVVRTDGGSERGGTVQVLWWLHRHHSAIRDPHAGREACLEGNGALPCSRTLIIPRSEPNVSEWFRDCPL